MDPDIISEIVVMVMTDSVEEKAPFKASQRKMPEKRIRDPEVNGLKCDSEQQLVSEINSGSKDEFKIYENKFNRLQRKSTEATEK